MAVLTTKLLEDELKKLNNEGWLSEKDIKECLAHFEKETKNGELSFTSPNIEFLFNAFNGLTPDNTRVLIIGQDPYPETTKACGLSFLHNTEQYNETDATLKNILHEINESATIKKSEIQYNKTMYQNWAQNNHVLLLNTSLTHENAKENIIKRHKKVWEKFVNIIIVIHIYHIR